MHKTHLTKPDGRSLWLYAHRPIPDALIAPSPNAQPVTPSSHLRWHPLRGEWVAYASHRQNRTFLPPPEWNPLAVMTDPAVPTELPPGPWEVAVFENLFPTLSGQAGAPPDAIVDTRPGKGACEVVVFTQDPTASLGRLPLERLELIIDVWADRFEGALDDVFDLQDRLSALGSHLPIVFLTGHADIPTTVKVMKAGADDLLTKPVTKDELIAALERAMARSRAWREKNEQLHSLQKLVDSLTPRERQVFERVARGKMNKEIGRELGATERTIKAHRSNIMEKLQITSATELVLIAERLGILAEQPAEIRR